ncbi:MAG: BamA/TamA family outer membrane protein, partial [Candidatus Hydrothermae bacterium]|nr:BamA/TamA family outer membrane protein [Candidatus Hydrothermae bacterium]
YSYSTLGPQNGSRARLLYVETGLPYLASSSSQYRSYRTWLADLRWYQKLTPRSLIALRLYGEINGGRDALPGWIGGPESVRGYDYFQFAGRWVGFSNLELRFPLIDHLQLAVPPMSLGNIRGALFVDAGTVTDGWETFSLMRDLRLSTGLGFRWDLGFTLLKVDLVRPFDLQQGWTGPWFTQFSLGPEF